MTAARIYRRGSRWAVRRAPRFAPTLNPVGAPRVRDYDPTQAVPASAAKRIKHMLRLGASLRECSEATGIPTHIIDLELWRLLVLKDGGAR